jgi:membrane-associated phospholipid phosphatase
VRLTGMRHNDRNYVGVALATLLTWGFFLSSIITLRGSRIHFVHLADMVHILIPISLMFGVSAYGFIRQRTLRIAWASWYFAIFLLGLVTMSLAQYAAALGGRPDMSNVFVAADYAFGFDWPAYCDAILSHRAVAVAMSTSYVQILTEALALTMLFIILDRRDRMVEQAMIAVLCYVMATVLCSLFPTQTAPTAYGRPDLIFDHPLVDQIAGLLSSSTVQIETILGTISFPSLHASGALMLIYLSRGIKWLFWPMLPFNAVVIAATPVFGGHFFVDVLAGAGIFMIAMVVTKRLVPMRVGPRRYDEAQRVLDAMLHE